MPRKLSNKTYAIHDGQKCPFCHEDGSVLSTDQIEADGGIGWESCKCDACGKTWTDQWKLIGYQAD